MSTDKKKDKKLTTVYITYSGNLKQVIAQHFNRKNISLKKTENNAPYLTGTKQNISLSHKDKFLIVAFSDGKVGVDLEFPKDKETLLRIARRYFCESENEKVKTVSDFYTAWTKKESYAKLTSEGLNSEILATDTFFDFIEIEGKTYFYCTDTSLDGYMITVLSEDKAIKVKNLTKKEN